jgi:hypothetical protein
MIRNLIPFSNSNEKLLCRCHELEIHQKIGKIKIRSGKTCQYCIKIMKLEKTTVITSIIINNFFNNNYDVDFWKTR